MALHPFSFPVPETRYFKAGSLIYKFKIRRGNSFSEGEVLAQDSFDQEMEEIVRTVLGDLDCLQPFSTPHFTVFPYRRSWGKGGKHRGKKLLFYPFVIILYLEKNICQGKQQEKVIQLIPAASVEPRSKRRRRDSPLEEAIIKEILKATEAECSISVTGTAELDHQSTVKQAVNDSAPTDEARKTASLGLKRQRLCKDFSGAPFASAGLREKVKPAKRHQRACLPYPVPFEGRVEEVGLLERGCSYSDSGIMGSLLLPPFPQLLEPQTTQSTPEKPGILKQLVRKIFPFIFRPPEA